MKKKLLAKSMLNILRITIILGVLIFATAGTFDFPRAWLALAVMIIPKFLLVLYLDIKKPTLLAKRLQTVENEDEQKKAILYSGLLFVITFLICGLDFRFGWSNVPNWLSVLGAVFVLLTYFGFFELLRENEFLSRTVEVQENQKVISTGLYGIVRHPMYAIVSFMCFSATIALGSIVAMSFLITLPFILERRIINEEDVLVGGLEGYAEYRKKVKFRVIPFIW